MIRALDSFDEQLRACVLFAAWGGDPNRCRGCDAELTGRRRRWCGDECGLIWGRNHWWSWARHAALLRDQPDYFGEWRCAHDGCPGSAALHARGLTTSVEVHHVEAILGRHGESGCHHHVDGLLTLHAVCHELEHHGGRSRYAPRPEQLGLDVA